MYKKIISDKKVALDTLFISSEVPRFECEVLRSGLNKIMPSLLAPRTKADRIFERSGTNRGLLKIKIDLSEVEELFKKKVINSAEKSLLISLIRKHQQDLLNNEQLRSEALTVLQESQKSENEQIAEEDMIRRKFKEALTIFHSFTEMDLKELFYVRGVIAGHGTPYTCLLEETAEEKTLEIEEWLGEMQSIVNKELNYIYLSQNIGMINYSVMYIQKKIHVFKDRIAELVPDLDQDIIQKLQAIRGVEYIEGPNKLTYIFLTEHISEEQIDEDIIGLYCKDILKRLDAQLSRTQGTLLFEISEHEPLPESLFNPEEVLLLNKLLKNVKRSIARNKELHEKAVAHLRQRQKEVLSDIDAAIIARIPQLSRLEQQELTKWHIGLLKEVFDFAVEIVEMSCRDVRPEGSMKVLRDEQSKALLGLMTKVNDLLRRNFSEIMHNIVMTRYYNSVADSPDSLMAALN